MKICFIIFKLKKIFCARTYWEISQNPNETATESFLYTFNMIWSFFGIRIFFESMETDFYIPIHLNMVRCLSLSILVPIFGLVIIQLLLLFIMRYNLKRIPVLKFKNLDGDF